MPKLLLVYHLLQEDNMEAIVHEISFLCSNEQAAWESAQVEVEVKVMVEGTTVTFPTSQRLLAGISVSSHPEIP